MKSFYECYRNPLLMFEAVFHKRNVSEKRKVKKKRRKAQRGTNFKTLGGGKSRKGFKRVKINDKKYSFVRQSPKERVTKKRIGHQLGKTPRLRK